jgi:thiol-disulfide isomerase/thioredoxin
LSAARRAGRPEVAGAHRAGRVRTLACAGLAVALLAGADEPPLDFETLAGERVRLALDEGEGGLVVHFWASWCADCAVELPTLDRAAQRCAGEVEVVAVNVGDDPAAIARFLGEHPLGLRVLRDPSGRVWRRVGGRGLPANLSLTREGRRLEVGPRDADGWRQGLSALGCDGSQDRSEPRAEALQ